jgi:hypothetical protein
MPSTVLAWRNWCTEFGTIATVVGSFEAGAPVTNMLTPRTGELAIATAPNIAVGFDVDWGGSDSPLVGRPVDIIALLNHNILELPTAGAFNIDILDADGGGYSPAGFPTPALFVASDGTFQSHLFWILPEGTLGSLDRTKVVKITVGIGSGAICGTRDAYTGVVTEAPFQAGGIWAGPIWTPEYGTKFESFSQSVSEIARGARSIGGQFYPNPEPRFRKGQIEFALLSEPEVYSTDVSQPSLQQLAAWCARSRPLIVIPVQGDADLIYTQGIYGYLEGDPTWTLRDSAHTRTAAQKGRVYTGGLSIAEAL